MMEKIKLLITGASGFIGKHLLEDIDYSKYDVRVITRDHKKEFNAQVKKLIADLNDINSLVPSLKDIDVVINIAAEIRDESKMDYTNVLGVKNLVKAVKINKVKRVIHLSSVGVVGAQYSLTPVSVDENAICKPKNKYEETKFKSEIILQNASQLHGFCLNILRPTNVFGEHHPYSALKNLFTMLDKRRVGIYALGSKVSYVYVKDVTGAIIEKIESTTEHIEVINVGYTVELKEFYSLISETINKRILFIKIPKIFIKLLELIGIHKLRSISNAVQYSNKDITYSYGLGSGIKRTILFYKNKDNRLP